MGVVKVPPTTFSYIVPTDGPILMSDIPNCSEIYPGSDATSVVAITWRMCAREVENRKYPVFKPCCTDLSNTARTVDSNVVRFCIVFHFWRYPRHLRGKIWLQRLLIITMSASKPEVVVAMPESQIGTRFQMQNWVLWPRPACRHHSPTSATSPRPSTKTRLEDVGLETGSSCSDVCITK